ncbi:MAG: hypothetical protein ABW185_10980 [Sedimenticola sp.]
MLLTMFTTLTNVQSGPQALLKPIDNSSGSRCVGLGSISFTVGWFYVDKEEGFGFERR